MDVTPLIPRDRKVITSYGPGLIRINDEPFTHPIILWPDRVERWAVSDPSTLTASDFGFLQSPEGQAIEVLLIGTGASMRFIPPVLRTAIRAMGPVPDAMDTGAACRTYNVLLAEGRPIAAALLPVPASP